jgi:hypothetical protein
VSTGVWWGILRERGHLEDPIIDERIILRWVSRSGMGVWTDLVWIRTGTIGGLLRMR